MIITIHEAFKAGVRYPFDSYVGLFRSEDAAVAAAGANGGVYARHAIDVSGQVFLLLNPNPVTLKDDDKDYQTVSSS